MLKAQVSQFVEEVRRGAGPSGLERARAAGEGGAAAPPGAAALPVGVLWSVASAQIWAEVWERDGNGDGSWGGDDGGGGGAGAGALDGDGQGEVRRAPKVLADVVEALIAAVWMDSGGDWVLVSGLAGRVMEAGEQ